jgi:hypothetical protein
MRHPDTVGRDEVAFRRDDPDPGVRQSDSMAGLPPLDQIDVAQQRSAKRRSRPGSEQRSTSRSAPESRRICRGPPGPSIGTPPRPAALSDIRRIARLPSAKTTRRPTDRARRRPPRRVRRGRRGLHHRTHHARRLLDDCPRLLVCQGPLPLQRGIPPGGRADHLDSGVGMGRLGCSHRSWAAARWCSAAVALLGGGRHRVEVTDLVVDAGRGGALIGSPRRTARRRDSTASSSRRSRSSAMSSERRSPRTTAIAPSVDISSCSVSDRSSSSSCRKLRSASAAMRSCSTLAASAMRRSSPRPRPRGPGAARRLLRDEPHLRTMTLVGDLADPAQTLQHRLGSGGGRRVAIERLAEFTRFRTQRPAERRPSTILLRLGDRPLVVGGRRGDLGHATVDRTQVLGTDGEPQGLDRVGHLGMTEGGGGLPLERPHPLSRSRPSTSSQPDDVGVGALEPPKRLVLADAVLEDPGRLLDHCPMLVGGGVEDRRDLTLPDDHVLMTPHTRVAQQLLDVEQAASDSVDLVVARAVAVETSWSR